jgi:LPS export ABC transporter protein LptC
MLNKISTGLFFLILVTIIYFVFLYDIKFMNKDMDSTLPDFSFENIVVSHFNDGKLESEFISDKATIYRKSNQINLFETQGAFFLDELTTVRFNSSSMMYNLNKSNIYMEDPYLVYLSDKSPVWLHSEQLYYDLKKNSIHTDSLTTVYFDEGYIQSRKVLFNLNDYKVYLDESPMFHLRLPDDKKN